MLQHFPFIKSNFRDSRNFHVQTIVKLAIRCKEYSIPLSITRNNRI